MQRAILLLALVGCASAQLFGQNYDFRHALQYVPVNAGDGVTEFAGALAYVPNAEFNQAIRFSSSYTQTVRPAANWIVAIDARFGANGQNVIDEGTWHMVVAAVGEGSPYREGDVVIVSAASAEQWNQPCFGSIEQFRVPLLLNSPVPHFGAGLPLSTHVACLIAESEVVAKLDFTASRKEAQALSLDNFKFVRRDRTIFGPTVF